MVRGLSHGEVSLGGVDTEELSSKTLESRSSGGSISSGGGGRHRLAGGLQYSVVLELGGWLAVAEPSGGTRLPAHLCLASAGGGRVTWRVSAEPGLGPIGPALGRGRVACVLSSGCPPLGITSPA
jgi:hypothetical protein